MPNKIRPIVLGSLLAFGAMAVRAEPKAAVAPLPISPAATPQSTPIDLRLHPTTPALSAPINPALQPASPAILAPINAALGPATPAPSALFQSPLESASPEMKRVARWILDTRNNAGLPYLLIDKVNAQVFAFNAAGQLQGTTPALLGLARGDRLLAPNDATMAQMPPEVRITPAGRFVSRLAIDSHGKELLVLNYDASISLHPMVKGTPEERRAERLKSPSSEDNRISFGCINVLPAFYSAIISPAFTGTKGIVYVLPETGQASALFGFQPDGAVAAGEQQSPALNSRAAGTGPTATAK